MSPSPATIAHEYECPRFEYTVSADRTDGGTPSADTTTVVEANYCVRRDDRLVFVEVTDIVIDGSSVALERTDVGTCDARVADTVAPDRVGTDVWELQVLRRPSLVERLLPWRWPPDVDESPFADVPPGGELVHPDPDELGRYTGDVLHSFERQD